VPRPLRRNPPSIISDPETALNVFDFEEAAHRKVLSGHWAYIASGVDDDATLKANREIFKHVQLRTRPQDLQQCASCQPGPGEPPGPLGEHAMFIGIDVTGVRAPNPAMDWVFVDGGFRRGTDIFKGLALGAKAVGVGRPFLWGLGAFGQAGVDRVIEILQGELQLAMGNCGTRTVADINRAYIATPEWKS
jgi:isopentenyl diphosphate isomerase/L-lactate dehydrogenase-like FMN-dependent dehydrogenase